MTAMEESVPRATVVMKKRGRKKYPLRAEMEQRIRDLATEETAVDVEHFVEDDDLGNFYVTLGSNFWIIPKSMLVGKTATNIAQTARNAAKEVGANIRFRNLTTSLDRREVSFSAVERIS